MTYRKPRKTIGWRRCDLRLKGSILAPVMRSSIGNQDSPMRTLQPRSTLLPLLAPLLLAGCVNESASYTMDGNDHGLTLVVTQDYFWTRQADVRVIASRLPDCQRQFDLGKAPLADLNVELFSTGEEKFLLRSGEEMWQVETQGCTRMPAPSGDVQAQPIGVFHLDANKKLVFDPAEGAVAVNR